MSINKLKSQLAQAKGVNESYIGEINKEESTVVIGNSLFSFAAIASGLSLRKDPKIKFIRTLTPKEKNAKTKSDKAIVTKADEFILNR